MFIELDRAQHSLLIELIEGRIHDLSGRREEADVFRGVPPRMEQLEMLQRLLHQLREAEWEVTC